MAGPQKLVAFMPWLWLEKSISVAGFTFAPFLDKTGVIAEPRIAATVKRLEADLKAKGSQ